MNMQKSIKIIIASAAMTAAAGASFAAGPLVPGGPALVPDMTTISAGATLITSSTGSMQSPVKNYTATAYSAVYQESAAANPLGGLTFVFQVANAAGGTENLDRESDFGFLGFTSNAFFSTQNLVGSLGQGTLAPGGAFETASGGVGFRFEATNAPTGVGLLTPGSTTDLMIVRTNAPNFTPSTLGISDATTVNIPSFAPASAVPEPATLATFALGGLGLLGLIARKTRRTGGAAA